MNNPSKIDVKLSVDAKLLGDGLGAHAHGHANIVCSPYPRSDEDSNLPFDNGQRFLGVFQILLKFRAIWQIKTEDMQFTDADHYEKLEDRMDGLLDQAIDYVQSLSAYPGNHGFEEQIL